MGNTAEPQKTKAKRTHSHQKKGIQIIFLKTQSTLWANISSLAYHSPFHGIIG